ncbi:MAG: hypothetical protein JNN08_00250 [Bryobacterales bacterium]|nr:hypothetical protein [Bryobacterales bacterium]
MVAILWSTCWVPRAIVRHERRSCASRLKYRLSLPLLDELGVIQQITGEGGSPEVPPLRFIFWAV